MYRSKLFLSLAAGLLATFATAPVEVRGAVTLAERAAPAADTAVRTPSGTPGPKGRAGAQTGTAGDSGTPSSSVAGTVVDSTGGAIRGARITVRRGGELVGESRSSDDGSYTLPLAPGEYLVEVLASGFDRAVQTIRVASGAAELDFELELTGLGVCAAES